eukprot:TRINITY_DN9563_c0_g1_i2.p1 TRINITY_DN9563_c0_g1~~TRINITY_DN9563_c0_g1_i2.p1  ORF type:complete len:270 (-),score=50.24 TRINITY_DN9563_c0_g1_i2:88-897(-)
MYFGGIFYATAIACALHAMSIGANDGANVLGVTVGGGTLTLRTAKIFMIAFELAGAFSGGRQITDASRTTYIDVEAFKGDESYLMLGILATMLGASTVIFLFSYWKLPISTTQVTGTALIVMALVTEGSEGGVSTKMEQTALSWVISPLIGGVLSFSLTKGLTRFMLRPGVSESRARRFMPVMFGLAFFIFPIYVCLSVAQEWVQESPVIIFSISLGLMALAIISTRLVVYDWLVELSFRISPLVEKSSLIVSTHVLKYGSSEDLVRKV